MLHQTHGLAIPPWGGHAEVAGNVLLGVASLLMADQQHRLITQTPNTAHQGLIIVAASITMQFNPVVTEHLDEIQGAGAMRVTGHLDLLGRR